MIHCESYRGVKHLSNCSDIYMYSFEEFVLYSGNNETEYIFPCFILPRKHLFFSLQFHADNNLWSDNKLHPIFNVKYKYMSNTFLCKNFTMATHPYKYIFITTHSKQNIYNIAEHSMIRLLTIFKSKFLCQVSGFSVKFLNF